MRKQLILIFVLISSLQFYSYGQNNRLHSSNSIAWFSFQATTSLKNQWSLQTEYHCRRVGGIEEWQQSLLRLGINYRLSKQTALRVGYALIENYAYGEYSINVYGKNFAEHRIYEALLHNHSEGKFSFSNRLMIEQRFVGKYSHAMATKEDSYVEVWEFYDIPKGTMCIFAEGSDKFLVQPTKIQFAFGHPFVMLRNYEVPEHF